jgi:hypothetical protein
MTGNKRARSVSPSAEPAARKHLKTDHESTIKAEEREFSSAPLRENSVPLTSSWTAINAGAPNAGKSFSEWTPNELGRLAEESNDSNDPVYKRLDEIEMDENLIPTEETQRVDDDEAGSDLELDDELEPYHGPDGKGILIPIEPRKLAKAGTKDMTMLAMLTKHSKTQELKELHFQNIVYAHIDWKNKTHITKINAWRNQIYGRANLGVKDVTLWNVDEEAWIEMYHVLLLKYAKKHPLRMHPSKEVWTNFNKFFLGKVLVDKDGNDLPPRIERPLASFTSKVTRLCGKMKEQLDVLSKGSLGNDYTPIITQEMIDEYKGIKTTLFSRLANYGNIVMNYKTLMLHAVNVRRLKNVKDSKGVGQESLTAEQESVLFAQWDAFFDGIKLPEPTKVEDDGSGSELSEVPQAIRSQSPSPEPKTIVPSDTIEKASTGPSKTAEPVQPAPKESVHDGAMVVKGHDDMDLDEGEIVEEITNTKSTSPSAVVATTTTTLKQTTHVDEKGETKEGASVESEQIVEKTRVTRASAESGIEEGFGSMSVRARD